MRPTSRLTYWGELIGWMALIVYLSGESFAASRTLFALQYWVSFFDLPISPRNVHLLNAALRKGAHFGEFFILGLLLYRALSGNLTSFRFGTVCRVLALGLLCSIGDELRQLISRNRTPSLTDSALDFSGVLASQLWILVRIGLPQMLTDAASLRKGHVATDDIPPANRQRDST